MNSFVNKNENIHVADDYASEAEESGWTAYLEDDFSCSNNGSLMISSPSLISDAAWHGSHSISQVKRLNFKNMKRSSYQRKYTFDEDDLEDTASSPADSPKVSTTKQMEMNNYQGINDVAAGNFLGKQAGSTNFSEHEKQEKNVRNNNVIDSRNMDHQYVALQKRGPCVVPMSASINYFV